MPKPTRASLPVVAAVMLLASPLQAEPLQVPAAKPQPLQAQAPQAQASSAPAYTVTIEHYGFLPQRLVVPQGAVVAWTNRDAIRHDATVIAGWTTGTIKSGETRTITASTPGTFQYKCSFHPDMRATLVVEAPK